MSLTVFGRFQQKCGKHTEILGSATARDIYRRLPDERMVTGVCHLSQSPVTDTCNLSQTPVTILLSPNHILSSSQSPPSQICQLWKIEQRFGSRRGYLTAARRACTVQYDAVQCSRMMYCTVQYSILYCTVQYTRIAYGSRVKLCSVAKKSLQQMLLYCTLLYYIVVYCTLLQ